MKKDKGFTLTEILVVIVLLGVVATISIPTVKSIIEKNRKKTFQESIKGIIRSTELYISSEAIATDFSYNYNDQEHIKTEKNHFTSGKVKYTDGTIIIQNFSDGNYCANGTSNDLTITKGICDVSIFLTEDNDGDSDVSMGDKVCIEDECFYVLKNEGDNTIMLSEWNLNVGYDYLYNGSYELTGSILMEEPEVRVENGAIFAAYNDISIEEVDVNSNTYNKQDSSKKGMYINGNMYSGDMESLTVTINGVINFSELDNNYWLDSLDNVLPKYSSGYIYDENSNIYQYVENYKTYLEELGTNVIDARLLAMDDIDSSLGIGMPPSWIFQTSYWTGFSILDEEYPDEICVIIGYESSSAGTNGYVVTVGVRPVIVIPTEDIQ